MAIRTLDESDGKACAEDREAAAVDVGLSRAVTTPNNKAHALAATMWPTRTAPGRAGRDPGHTMRQC
jgi:hypothetical protein